jgi:hypothetical protein
MIDDILECLVDLAHFDKIDGVAAIQSQVNWRYADCWGADILNIVNAHAPPVIKSPPRETLQAVENLLGPSTGQQPSGVQDTASNIGSSSSKSKPRAKAWRCSACRSTTHIGTSSISTPYVKLILSSSTASNHMCLLHKSHLGVRSAPNENVFMVSVTTPNPTLPKISHMYSSDRAIIYACTIGRDSVIRSVISCSKVPLNVV